MNKNQAFSKRSSNVLLHLYDFDFEIGNVILCCETFIGALYGESKPMKKIDNCNQIFCKILNFTAQTISPQLKITFKDTSLITLSMVNKFAYDLYSNLCSFLYSRLSATYFVIAFSS